MQLINKLRRRYLIAFKEGAPNGFFLVYDTARKKTIIEKWHRKEEQGEIKEFIIYFPNGMIYDSILVRWGYRKRGEYRYLNPEKGQKKRFRDIEKTAVVLNG